jgi:hypothetical protein
MSSKPVPEEHRERSGTRLGWLPPLPAWVMWRFVIGARTSFPSEILWHRNPPPRPHLRSLDGRMFPSTPPKRLGRGLEAGGS